MTTTIQVSNETKELLNNLKRSHNSKTYDEVIKTLAKRKTKSLYGSLASRGDKGSFKKAMKILHELRDSSDRFKNIR